MTILWGRLLICGAALLAAPAVADVKAGVEAWSRHDDAVAVREWQGPAARGDADAQFNMGQAYKLGRGIKQDLVKAEDMYARAAAQGHLKASDFYGLMLFQRGEPALALPYLRAAADRGNPDAQYLLGIAHFNGQLVAKDWVRAYALVTLAQQAGIPDALTALKTMDQYVSMPERQQAVLLSAELASQAEATRARQLAAIDLGATVPAVQPVPTVALRPPPVTPRSPSTADAADAVARAVRIAGNDSPATAGADYARPRLAAATPRPAPPTSVRPQPAGPPAPVVRPPVADASGAWRVQLGAFGVAANADALWNRVRSRPELAGHPRLNVGAGGVTKLQAGGFASREAAQAACSRLAAAGFACVPAQR